MQQHTEFKINDRIYGYSFYGGTIQLIRIYKDMPTGYNTHKLIGILKPKI